MTLTFVGSKDSFAIESAILEAYKNSSQRALGFFVIYVAGKCYGVRDPDATIMGCSLGTVEERLGHRGKHCVSFSAEPNANKIMDAYLAALYDSHPERAEYFGLSIDALSKLIYTRHIQWAPDGDEAFDDSSHVLQFDACGQVRLVAFKNIGSREEIAKTLSDVWISADVYYGVLTEWRRQFLREWVSLADQYKPGGELLS
jgi:hypothetical protein